MTGLAWANIKHRKLRSSLAALAVAIGVAMLVTMLALSHGTLEEVAQRAKGIDAELILMPPKSSLIFSDGASLSDGYIPKVRAVRVDGRAVVQQVIPVFWAVMPQMAGQQQRVFGIEGDHIKAFANNRSLVAGTMFTAEQEFIQCVDKLRQQHHENYQPNLVPEAVLNRACQLVIDDRLARAGHYKVGDQVPFMGHDFTICGIIQTGAAARVFAPIEVVRHIQNGGFRWSTLFFVKLEPGLVDVKDEGTAGKLSVAACSQALAQATDLKSVSLGDYDKMLFNNFRSVYLFINVASVLILVVSFLFIVVTIYTMVLERRREIGILRSMGATGTYIMGQTILEALTISICGMGVGLLLALAAKEGIERFQPLLTVDMQPRWLILGVAVGLLGGLISALYPGYCALRQDPLAALGYE